MAKLLPETCRYCGRPIILAVSTFWQDDRGLIYCFAVLGPHQPAKKEPEDDS